MCRAATCAKATTTTRAGCGLHVDSVMRGVRASDRCQGHGNEPSTGLFATMLGRWPPEAAHDPRAR